MPGDDRVQTSGRLRSDDAPLGKSHLGWCAQIGIRAAVPIAPNSCRQIPFRPPNAQEVLIWEVASPRLALRSDPGALGNWSDSGVTGQKSKSPPGKLRPASPARTR